MSKRLLIAGLVGTVLAFVPLSFSLSVAEGSDSADTPAIDASSSPMATFPISAVERFASLRLELSGPREACAAASQQCMTAYECVSTPFPLFCNASVNCSNGPEGDEPYTKCKCTITE